MELLKKLTGAFGPSGNEEPTAKLIIDEIKDYVDEINIDKLGNVIALKKGSSINKIMTTAHMDQIGIMVTDIDKNGFIRFTNVGYVDPYAILYHNVVFKNGINGVIGYEKKKNIKEIKLGDLYIDIGSGSKEDAGKLVKIGDFGIFKSNYVENGNKVSAGALDDRIGCYVLIEAAKKIKTPKSDIYYVFTVQEESYLSGATTSAYAIEPDCAIVVDVTDTGDTPNCSRMALKLGEGAAIKVMDKGMITHPKVKKFLIDEAERNNIKYQFEVMDYGATDGAEIHVSKSGVMTGAISIPTRYLHTPQEVLDMRDVECAIELLTKSLEEYEEL